MNDLEALQGVWEQIAFEIDGAAIAQDPYDVAGILTTFRGQQFVVHTRDDVILLKGDFTFDASRDPKEIDWTDSIGPDAGKILPAIYRLDGDRFIFVAADSGMPRPTRFETVAGQTLRSFVRHRG